MKRAIYASLLIILTLVLPSCNLPSQAQSTQGVQNNSTAAAQTVQAQLTSAAPLALPTTAVIIPTNTVPAPTAVIPTNPPATTVSASPTSNCNSAQFITDVTIPDGTIIQPNQAFSKTWRLKNSGTCSWTPSYAAVFSSGNAMGGPATQALAGNVNPGQTVDITVNFTAPGTPGNYTAYYKLRDASGMQFTQFYVQVKVQNGGDADDTEFAVTSVSFTTSGGCGTFNVTANITTNDAGTVTYSWRRSDGATDTVEHSPLTYASAGTQSVSTSWSTTNPGAKWIDIYIDAPNHQQFGRASFTCP